MSLWRIFAMPVAAALCIVGGLFGALLGSGVQDTLACALLVSPLLWGGWMLRRTWPSGSDPAQSAQVAGKSSLHRSMSVAVMAGVSLALMTAALLRAPQIGLGGAVWLWTSLVTFAIRAPHGWRNRANRIVVSQRGGAESILMAAVFLTVLVLPLIHLATGWFSFATYPVPLWATLFAVAMQVPYVWLFWRSHADLDRNWSPGLELRDGHGLVTSGVYGRIRHPMYAAVWLSVLAQPLLIPNVIAGMLALPAFAALWWVRVPREEAMMRETFGEAYDAYVARTGRVLPRWRRQM